MLPLSNSNLEYGGKMTEEFIFYNVHQIKREYLGDDRIEVTRMLADPVYGTPEYPRGVSTNNALNAPDLRPLNLTPKMISDSLRKAPHHRLEEHVRIYNCVNQAAMDTAYRWRKTAETVESLDALLVKPEEVGKGLRVPQLSGEVKAYRAEN